MDETEDNRGKIAPKKSLGQNFLNSDGALRDMIDAAGVAQGDTVLEIGPGKGALTKKLLEAGARIIAIEKDGRLLPHLEEAFPEEITSGRLAIIEGDALEIDLRGIPGLEGGYKVVANIPYYITGAFLRKYLSAAPKPASMTLIVQKEVADRIVARDGQGSVLSISVKAYGAPKYVATVKAGSFFPKPSVDSAIIHINGISTTFFDGFSEDFLFEVVKAGFSQKRKMLKNNLSRFGSAEEIEKALASCGISPSARAETLTLEQWGSVTRALAPIREI